jgi:hypothetical protein
MLLKTATMLACVMALSVSTSSALADDAIGMEAAFGNTIVSTYPDGRIAKLWLDRNGDFHGLGRTGNHYSGRWNRKGDKLCLRQERPIPIPFHFCTPIVQGGVGATWQATSVGGDPLTVKIVPGRETDPEIATAGNASSAPASKP